MSVVYSATVKTARMQVVASAINGGGLVIGDNTLSGSTGILGQFTLTAGSVSGSVMTISGTPLTTGALAGGTASLAELRDSSGNTIVSGLTVGTSNADIIMSSVSVSSGGTLTLLSGSITHS